MYVYLDETTFGQNGEYSGYASFITSKRIDNELINKAIDALSNDPDINKKENKYQDDRTLKRKYFHASDDSQNAHSHICNAVNSHIIGEFKSHFFKTKENGFNNSEEAYELASKLSILSVFSESYEIVFIFEERNNLSKEYIVKWWDSLWKDLFKSQYTYPFIRTYYPMLNFEICTKKEPGLQIVDFILWASSRQVLEKKCPWLRRLKSWLSMETKPEDGSWGGHSLSFRLKKTEKKKNYDIEDYRIDDEKLNSPEYLAHYIIHAQKLINQVESYGPQEGVRHFWEDVRYLKNTNITKSNSEHIEKIAKCFLKLFDNADVIKQDTTPDDKAFWLMCRKCLAFTLHTHDLSGKMHSLRLSDIRNHIIENEPNALQQC